ncbi:uncharacterized protein K02A2.6-like [Dendronephthya gigantea]|uniref:uncharacterized protein K02A2.6-like n=1 Tax=Dendronephthya gigantea TaxID=151771 RepID=UPI00106D36F0|nr:uncharacterized protein K02A2.6-like [Dendronephthya gigantea]
MTWCQPISLTGNLAKNWKNWRQTWQAYEVITNLAERDQKYRVATFITCIGPEAMEIHNGLPFRNDEERQDITKIIELWNNYCIGKTNPIYERYKFHNRFQQQGETIDTYATVIRTLADRCKFGALKEELVRDRIVCGIRDNTLQKKLLQETSLTLEKCLNICRAAEAANNQQKQISHNTSESTHALKPKGKPQFNSQRKPKLPCPDCKYCGRRHERKKEKCPAYNKTCNNCSMKHHFSSVCQQPKRQERGPKTIQTGRSKTHQVHEETDQSTDDEIWSITERVSTVPGRDCVCAGIQLGDQIIQMQIDTGATCNVLRHSYLPKDVKVQPTNRNLFTYSESKLEVLGKAVLNICNQKNNCKYFEEFLIVKDGSIPLLGVKTAQKMELLVIRHQNILHMDCSNAVTSREQQRLSKEDVLSKYADQFTGLGKIEGKLHLEVDETVTPVVMPPRRVPIAVKPKLKEELDRLEALNVLVKEEKPTAWVSGFVASAKPNGKVRVCIDPQHLNTALKRRHYPLPVVEEILPELDKAKFFTKADLKDGYLQIQLDEDSSKLTTFQTTWGRSRWLRMPYGICPASECFQQKLDQCLEGLPGVYKIADDLLIIGKGDTDEEAECDHDQHLTMLFEHVEQRMSS